MVDCLASFFVISNKFGWHIASRCRFPGLPESVLLDFFDAEPLHVSLPQAEDEAGLAKFEVDLNEGRLDQVGDVLQTNGGGLLLFVVLFYAVALRELSQFAAVDVDGDLAAKWLRKGVRR